MSWLVEEAREAFEAWLREHPEHPELQPSFLLEDALEHVRACVDDRPPRHEDYHLARALMGHDPHRLTYLLTDLIATALRHSTGCRICGTLPNASGHIDHPLIGTLCRRCRDRVEQHERDLVEARLEEQRERGRQLAAERDQKRAEQAARQLAVFAVSDDHPGLVKIGASADPATRYEKNLGLRVIHLEPGGTAREAELHHRFARHRLLARDLPDGLPRDGQTEWFTFASEIQDYIADQTTEDEVAA